MEANASAPLEAAAKTAAELDVLAKAKKKAAAKAKAAAARLQKEADPKFQARKWLNGVNALIKGAESDAAAAAKAHIPEMDATTGKPKPAMPAAMGST